MNSSLKAGVEGGLYDAVWLDGVDLELLGVAHQHGLRQLHRVTQAERNTTFKFHKNKYRIIYLTVDKIRQQDGSVQEQGFGSALIQCGSRSGSAGFWRPKETKMWAGGLLSYSLKYRVA